MSFWQRKSTASRNDSPALSPPEREAEDQFLNKQGKIRTAMGAVFLRHLGQVAHDDVHDVRKLKAKHLGGPFAVNATGDDVGDMVICDNYNFSRNEPPPKSRVPAWLVAVAIAAGAGLAGFLGKAALDKQPTPPTPPPQAPQRWQAKWWIENGELKTGPLEPVK